MDLELRTVVEVRARGRELYGIAAPFNREADIGGMFRESIAPGAFTRSLASGADVLALVDHRADALLGRTRSGSLRLSETAEGLQYAIDIPPTSMGNDVLALAHRGDLGGVSIGFTADEDTWSPDRRTRQLRAVTLHEISVIHGHAAYGAGTTIALRDAERHADARRHLDPHARRRLLAML